MPRSGAAPCQARAAKSALLILAVAARAAAYFPDLHFSGACDAKGFLNGLTFQYQGHTASGAPWYKSSSRNEYLYWDLDCGGGGDGQPRWIVTDRVPDPTRLRDLDGDNLCNYHGRNNNVRQSYPPNTDFWQMDCGGVIKKLLIVIADITTTSTSTITTKTTTTTTSTISTTSRTTTSTTGTTTSRTTTSRTTTTRTATSTVTTITETTTRTRTSTVTSTTETTTRTRTTTSKTTTSGTGTSTTRTTTSRTTTTATTTTMTTTLMVLTLTGACPFKYFLDKRTFVEQGYSANGARWFKAEEVEGLPDEWMYYDLDCNGGNNGAHRWIIDDTPPHPEFKEDLDQDGKCNYHARLDSDDIDGPPKRATWQMFCGLGWTDAPLHLDNTKYRFDDGIDESTILRLRGLFFEHCPEKAFLDNMLFDYAGNTASGAPYYASHEYDQYIYFDPHCSGSPESSSKWIIDPSRPSETAEYDLDEDGTCSYHARVKSKNTKMPPKGSMWRIECGNEWKDIWLELVRLPTAATTTDMVATQEDADKDAATQEEDNVQQDGKEDGTPARPAKKKIINSAAGSAPLLAALLLCLVHVRGLGKP